MTIEIKPKFQSAIPDNSGATAAGKVTPSRWNEGSNFTMDGPALIGRSSGNGAAQEMPPADVRTMLSVPDQADIDALQVEVDALQVDVTTLQGDVSSVEASVSTAQADIDALEISVASKEPTIAAGSTSQYLRGDKSWQTLNKAAVGLSNVDNTSDVSKPVSTATQTAINTGIANQKTIFPTRDDAAAITIPVALDAIEVYGRTTELDGGGGKYLRTVSTVIGAFQDQNSVWWKPDLNCPIKPETFGAKGGNIAFDDSTGIQDMLDAIAVNGRGVGILTPGRTYYPGDDTSIVIDPYRQTLIGYGAYFDFQNKTFGDPSGMPELLSNPSFTSTASWINLPTNTNNWVISGGVAEHTTTAADEYGGLYQTVSMVNGRRYRMVAVVQDLDAGTTQNYLNFSVRDGGPDDGGGPSKIIFSSGTYPATITFEYVWSYASGTAWFQFKGQSHAIVDSISLKELPSNSCVSITSAGDTSGFYGQAPQFIEGLSIIGPTSGDGRLYGEGIFSHTDASGYSSRFSLRNFDIHNFGTGIKLSDRTYLPRITSGDIYACETGVHFMGTQDAGENIRFSMVDIYNSKIGILNEGAYLHFVEGSLDYTTTHFVKLVSGYAHFFGTHFERNAGSVADSYPFYVSGDAELETHGGYIQVGLSPATPVLDYIAFLENDRSRWLTYGTRVFGFTTATGEIIGGSGRKVGAFEGIGNKGMSAFAQKNDENNLTSPAAGDSSGNLIWDAFAYGGARTDPRTTAYAAITTDNVTKRTTANRTLKVTKGGGTNDPGTVNIYIPLYGRGMFSIEWWNEVLDTTGSGTVQFWTTLNWVQRNGFDANGVPVISKRAYNGEVAQNVVLGTGITSWARVALTSTYDDDTSTGTDGYRPAWATHVEIAINLVNIPGASNLYIADAMANLL